MDTLAPEPFAGVELLQVRMHLDLMRGGHDIGFLDESFCFLAREIRDADRLGFSLLIHPFHRFPRVHVVRVPVDGLSVAIFGDHGAPSTESDRPVHEVEVYVVCAEVLEGGIEGGFDVGGVVGIVPQFGGDEEAGAGDAGFSDGGTTGGLSAISESVINEHDREEGDGCWRRKANMRAVSMCL